LKDHLRSTIISNKSREKIRELSHTNVVTFAWGMIIACTLKCIGTDKKNKSPIYITSFENVHVYPKYLPKMTWVICLPNDSKKFTEITSSICALFHIKKSLLEPVCLHKQKVNLSLHSAPSVRVFFWLNIAILILMLHISLSKI